MDDITQTPVIDLRAVAEQKAEQRRLDDQKKNAIQSRVENSRIYEASVKGSNGGADDIFQVEGTLMLTGSFFAIGTPLLDGTGVDFKFAAPCEQINYVLAIEDEDFVEEST